MTSATSRGATATKRLAFQPFTVDKADGLCPYCHRVFAGLLKSWRMLAHYLLAGCADPWGN